MSIITIHKKLSQVLTNKGQYTHQTKTIPLWLSSRSQMSKYYHQKSTHSIPERSLLNRLSLLGRGKSAVTYNAKGYIIRQLSKYNKNKHDASNMNKDMWSYYDKLSLQPSTHKCMGHIRIK